MQSSPMLGLAIELRTECRACGQPLPVNAYTARIVCRACHHANDLDDELWESLLEDAFAGLATLEPDEGQCATIMTSGSTFERTCGRQVPRCRACKAPFPDQALAFAERGWAICVACGQRFGIRPARGVIAKLGAIALVDEDPAQVPGTGPEVAAPVATTPIVMACPQCAGGLAVDGTQRLVRCRYCTTDVYLPDALWQRLHPVAKAARWYAWFAQRSIAELERAVFRWRSVDQIVLGPDHALYCVGTAGMHGDEPVAWSMGLDLQVRWIQKVPLRAALGDGLRVATINGQVLVWAGGTAHALVFAASDGALLGKRGEKEYEGARAHGFDLREGRQLVADVDGTLLAQIESRLVRYSAEGAPLATWPARAGLFGDKPEKLRPLYDDGRVRSLGNPALGELEDQPLSVPRYGSFVVGAEGRLYVEDDGAVACFDRTGTRVYRVTVTGARALGSDGYGQLYVLARVEERHTLLRVLPDGSRIDVVANAREVGGILGGEYALVVTADGTCLLFGSYGCVRVIAPDGRFVYQNDASRRADAEADEDAAEADADRAVASLRAV